LPDERRLPGQGPSGKQGPGGQPNKNKDSTKKLDAMAILRMVFIIPTNNYESIVYLWVY